METIILQIVQETVKKIMGHVEKNGLQDLASMAEQFKAFSDGMAREVLGAVVSAADRALRDAREERMGDGVKIRQSRVPRALLTALGEFGYERTYFDTPGGREYILDKILGVPAYERVDPGVSAKLVNCAASHSYEKSAGIVTGGQVSRQSVRNKVANTGEVAYVPGRAGQAPETLHIFADEDHVSLQNGKGAIVPLITVCGGKRPVCEGRNELVEPFHVQGYGMKPEAHWGYVYALCAQKYDLEEVKQVYVYGDGAAWIAKFEDVFPGAVHVLDGFHFKKRMKSLFAGEICSKFSLAAHGAVRKDDKGMFDRAVQSMLEAVEAGMPAGKGRAARVKAVVENAGYVLNHWEAVQNMWGAGSIGSCTEAMVSHVLSPRLSRSPMGWSEAGLSKMSMIRVFVVNGGRVGPADTLARRRSPEKNSVAASYEKYEAIVRKQQDEVMKGAKNWRWFETEDLISGKTTGTKAALDALGLVRKAS